MRIRNLITIFVLTLLIISIPLISYAATILFHLKTGLKQDDAQICVAYNEIWAAREEGFDVDVLIDASAVYTYKKGFFGKDSLENYKLPENMRELLANQFKISIEDVPKVYGEYLKILNDKGVNFYINSEMLVTAGIAKDENDLSKISTKFFKPIAMKEIIRLRTKADFYMAY